MVQKHYKLKEDYMMGLNSTMANREVQKLIFMDYNTKKPFLNLDFANTTTRSEERRVGKECGS